MSNFGTTAQFEHATKLAQRAGYKTLEEAAEAQTGRPSVLFNVTPFTKNQASEVITFLERKLNLPPRPPRTGDKGPNGAHPAGNGNGSANGAGHGAAPEDAKPKARFLTARHLRRITQHLEQPPEDLDDDAKWVLGRLYRLDAVEAFVRRGQPEQRLAVNGTEQIKVAHLVEYFHSEQAAADAFQVSLQTLRAWGEFIPPAHAYKAEVLTLGYVSAPRH